MRIGFIGLGVMGSRMSIQLLNAGYELIVYNRTAQKIEPLLLLGAQRAKSISELAHTSDVICSCLSMPHDVVQVYEGEEGIFQHARPGSICIDFTTVGMEFSRKMEEKAKERDIRFLDAPVSGGPEGASTGKLTIMVGGNAATFEQVLPLLETLGSNVQYLGESGMGSAAKLMNQYMVAVHSLAAAEVMVTGTHLGLAPEQLYDILKNSYGDSRMLRRHVEGHILQREFEPGGALKYLLKDLRLSLPLMQKAGLKSIAGSLAEEALQEACEQGHADKDMSAVILPLEKMTNSIVRHKSKSISP
jgi:3-hydroxyisobutyrate dehydrogenase